MQQVQTAIKTKVRNTPITTQVLKDILQEIRLLRTDLMLLLPEDDIKDYAHPERIRRSYQNALRQYPPA